MAKLKTKLSETMEIPTNTILHGDALTTLQTLPSGSVHCIITSPPYWNQRDYEVEGQIGREVTINEYVEKLTSIFREARRVLRDNGTFWLNMGDCYAGSMKGMGAQGQAYGGKKQRTNAGSIGLGRTKWGATGLKNKDLVGLPWRVAFALQEDGWYLRMDCIWEKANAMPESVRDRPTKSHEYLFLFAKCEHYYYDADAIKEPVKSSPQKIRGANASARKNHAYPEIGGTPIGKKSFLHTPTHRNKRSVWSIPTAPFKGAHFATFPPKLIEPCVLAGCPQGGIILDPFFGSGTTGLVAQRHGRQYLGIELNADYIMLAQERLRKTQ